VADRRVRECPATDRLMNRLLGQGSAGLSTAVDRGTLCHSDSPSTGGRSRSYCSRIATTSGSTVQPPAQVASNRSGSASATPMTSHACPGRSAICASAGTRVTDGWTRQGYGTRMVLRALRGHGSYSWGTTPQSDDGRSFFPAVRAVTGAAFEHRLGTCPHMKYLHGPSPRSRLERRPSLRWKASVPASGNAGQDALAAGS
jgi:hypothetical protein